MGVVIGERSGYHGAFLGYWADPLQFVLGNVLEPFLVMSGVLLLRACGRGSPFPVPLRRALRTLAARRLRQVRGLADDQA